MGGCHQPPTDEREKERERLASSWAIRATAAAVASSRESCCSSGLSFVWSRNEGPPSWNPLCSLDERILEIPQWFWPWEPDTPCASRIPTALTLVSIFHFSFFSLFCFISMFKQAAASALTQGPPVHTYSMRDHHLHLPTRWLVDFVKKQK